MQQQRGVFARLDRGADDRHRRRGPYRQHRVIALALSLVSCECDFEGGKCHGARPKGTEIVASTVLITVRTVRTGRSASCISGIITFSITSSRERVYRRGEFTRIKEST